MIRFTIFISVMFCTFFGHASEEAAWTIIKAGQLLEPETGRLEKSQLILIEGEEIVAVGADIKIPDGAKVIDLSDSTVLPGLMDAHTHLCWYFDKYKSGYLESIVAEPTAFRAIQGVKNAKDMLMAGFTYVRDLGNAANYADTALLRGIKTGLVPGPHMKAAGRLITPFGGQLRLNAERQNMAGQEYYFADSHDELRKAIRENIHFGANVIKLVSDSQRYMYSEEDVRFVVAQASELGLKVAVHTDSDKAAVQAVKGGAHTLEHGFGFEDRETYRLIRKKGVYFVSTSFPKPMLRAMKRLREQDEAELDAFYKKSIVAVLRTAYEEKVKVAFGSDMIAALDDMDRGQAALSYIDVFQEAGATPLQIIQAMTVNAAQAIDVYKKHGKLEKGYIADIIATKKNPISDIHALKEVHFVMKDGDVYKH